VDRAGREDGDLSNRIQQRRIDAYRTRRAVLLIEISKAMGHRSSFAILKIMWLEE
jgi:hypothetical protein